MQESFRRWGIAVSMALALAGLSACAAQVGTGGSAFAQTVAVSVDPGAATLAPGQTTQLTATVTGSTDAAVTWQVDEAGGGSVDASGLYTAPAATGTFHVRATSHAAPDVYAEATFTVATPPAGTVLVSPATAAVAGCTTQTFSATVSGAAGTAVTWTVAEGSAGGTVSAAGVYTAPSTAGTYHVVATSVASGAATATATVTVRDRIDGITLTPTTVAVAAGGTQQFTANIRTSCGTFAATAR
jgi:hypothetical protein